MTRYYWLSFAEQGRGFLGACVVTVNDDDRRAAETELLLGRHALTYDHEEGPWVKAAINKAWADGCNPGGEVASWWFDAADAEVTKYFKKYPLNTLLSKTDITRITGEPPIKLEDEVVKKLPRKKI